MADGIKIGNLDISAFKVGSSDCKVYLGDALLYPNVETIVVAKYNVTDTSSPTQIIGDYSDSPFSAIEIDGVVQPSVVNTYTFSTTGEHTVKYTLTDPTSIGNSAFDSCSCLTTCTIGSGVTSIGESAFYFCASLTSIDMPNSVASIGNYAFSRCSGLTSCTIGSGVTSISESAFQYCESLTSIVVDSNNTVYDSRNNCNAIIETSTNTLLCGCQNTVIPNSVTSIGNDAFDGCSNLTSIVIPNSVTSIGNYTFYFCTSLTSIDIPNSVTSIGNSAFQYCSGLTSCTIGSGVTSIGNGAFGKCKSLTTITCNAMVAPAIGKTTFEDVKTGGTLTVPSGSSGYDTWMQNANYYLGKYNWTKVEQ